MKKIAENLNFLKLFCNCTKKLHKHLINGANQEHIICLCECILNCLNGNVNLNEPEKSQLKKYKKRMLTKKKLGLKKRKQLLIQKGSGFLPLIIPAVIAVVTDFLTRS